MVRQAPQAFALFFCALSLLAQDDVSATTQPYVTIKGTVVDASTGIPVAGAKVALRYTTSAAPLDNAVTGAPGDFELAVKQPGNYTVEASAPGYLETVYSDSKSGIAIGDTEFEQGAREVLHKIELKLPGSGSLTGLVRDADSRKPLPRVTVRALRLWWWRGKRQATEEQIVFTDDEGVFRVGSLPPGEYVVLLGNTAVPAGVADDRPPAYPILPWPSGDPDNIIPLTLRSAELNVGVIDYAKILGPRMIRVPECHSPVSTQVWLDQRIAGAWFTLSRASISVCPLISPIPVLPPGRYRLTSSNVVDFQFGAEEITIRGGEDREVALPVFPPAPVTGKITCECDKPMGAAVERIKVGISPFPPGEGMLGTIASRADGTFSGLTAIAGEALIGISGIPDGLFMKRLLFNGKESGKMVTMNLGTAASVEVILSDKPATITGAVIREGKPAAHDHVVLARWPTPAGVDYFDFDGASVDDAGSFSITNLAPGTYRATSVRPDQWSRKEMPNAVANWLASADGFTIAEGETRTIRIEVK